MREMIKEIAISFGAEFKYEDGNENGNAVLRYNPDRSPEYIGIIAHTQERTGQYEGLSLVVFPSKNYEYCLVALAVGTQGLGSDYELAALPGLRRAYIRLQQKIYNDQRSVEYFPVCKQSFVDIENKINILRDEEEDVNIRAAFKEYGKLVLASQFIYFDKENTGKSILSAWIATYAKYREWARPSTKKRKSTKAENIKNTLNPYCSQPVVKEYDEVKSILESQHFVVLQGAPGTGKTRMASQLYEEWKRLGNKCHFSQFHAETTYSEFIGGIVPDTDNTNADHLRYKQKEGILIQALKEAKQASDNKTNKKVLLVIDEINRANLSNVLGEAMYLFERGSSNIEEEDKNVCIKVGNFSFKRSDLKHFYLLATMNTSDRSLAVIDFALRRRFIWYTLKPHAIEFPNESHLKFHADLFGEFVDLFDKYASDFELSLQPGQSYFITSKVNDEEDKQQMILRMKYELMPLMKEYFHEGFMLKSVSDFSNLFFREAGLNMYE